MKIVVVSAHYPPNFVSGGTLQAQRLAHGLRARDYEVSVYAGWFGKERPTGERWDEVDDTGLPVRWVVTTPWTLWDDDRNWDNPEVAADFRAYLAGVQPDVVHLHSLQSLGAGLVSEAARAGARVVVTMHDFWWFCARQFLVDRRVQPCSLVVDAGLCPCECDRSWLLGRNRALREVLGSVDAVLAPSVSAAAVLAANGVDPARLAVDENSLPAGLTADRPSTEVGKSGLRLVYVGGPNPLKGVHVLLDAAEELAATPGWRLTAYGAEPYLETSGRSVAGLPVDLVPAFDPAGAEAVYGGADVVVIPSVMRETFSLVAREALTRGVPVICTDTLGPEEVVEHEGNGLIVPAADADALAHAIRRLLIEPDLLPRLRAGCGQVTVRTARDQLDGLEKVFAQVAEAPAAGPTASSDPVIRRVLFVCGIDGAPLRYRARLPAEGLGLVGVDSDVVHYREPELAALAARAGAVVFYRVPATVQVLALIDKLRSRGTTTFFDVDDLIFDPDIAEEIPALELLPSDEAALWLQGVQRYRTTMEACDVYVGSTGPLCRHAATVTRLPVRRFDNGVGLLLGQLSDRALDRPRRPGPPRMGYLSGTKTHDLDWLSIEPAIEDVMGRHPELELWLVGHVNVTPALGRFRARIRRHPFRPWYELPGLLRDLDVNLAPLVPGGRFNEAKSPIKWLEAALTETATVAVPSEPLREVVRAGQNGMLAEGLEQWVEALDRLLDDPDFRRRMGRRARRDVLLSLSPHLQGRRYAAVLDTRPRSEVGDSGARHTPVALDEPPLRVALEPYDAGGLLPPEGDSATAGDDRGIVPRASRLATKAWSSWRSDGAAATAHRAAAFSRRQFDTRIRPRMGR